MRFLVTHLTIAWLALLATACSGGGGGGGGTTPAPIANDDSATANEDSSVEIDVLANDEAGDEGDALLLVGWYGATSGTVSQLPGGALQYVPYPGFSGTDTFSYTVAGAGEQTDSATVTITINEVGDAPVAASESYSTDEDSALVIPAAEGVLANDFDVDTPAVALSAVIVATTTSGLLELAADGSFLYTPAADFHGSDSFTYRVSDGVLESGDVTVTIEIASKNDPPLAAADAYQTAEDTPAIIAAPGGLLANDIDVDDPLRAVLIVPPQHGVLVLATDGSFTFSPDLDYTGADSFVYAIADSLSSSEAIVDLTVTAVADDPSLQIAAIRSAPDGSGLELHIDQAWVTYVKPAIGTEPAGFFLQWDVTGPAIFVADATPLDVGDEVEVVVESIATVEGMRHVTALSSLQVLGTGNDVQTLVQTLSAATDLVTAVGSYESELVRVTGRVESELSHANGFASAQLVTAGVPVQSALLVARMPDPIADSVNVHDECNLTLGSSPLWRRNTTAEVMAWSAADISGKVCDRVFADYVTNNVNPTNQSLGAGLDSVWSYEGNLGAMAGRAMCLDIGASRVCTYEDIVRSNLWKENLASELPDGSTFWIHRLQPVDVAGEIIPAHVGARCNDWTFTGYHLANGEWGEANGDVLTFNFDHNPCYGSNNLNGCAGWNLTPCWQVQRLLLCCHTIP